jgi:DNA-binding MarR family transcriptional regulator
MAREKTVSRQHIQMIVNKLLERGWVECIVNPTHTRSSLIRMTSAGTQLFGVIRRREAKLLAVIEKQLAKKNLLITAQTLQTLDEYFQSQQWQGSLPPQTKGETS